MKMQIGAMLGIALVVATALGQSPQDKAEDRIRLKARLELAELDHEVTRNLLKEVLSLLRRAERTLQVDRDRPEEQLKQDAAQLEALRTFVEKERKYFEEQAVESARLRKELAESETQAQQPSRQEISRAEKAMEDFMKQGRSRKAEQHEQQKSREAGPNQEELGDQFEAAQLDLNLLNSRMNIISSSLSQRMNTLAGLEVQAADPESKDDEKVQKALVTARKRYDEARKSYLEMRKIINQETNKMSKLRQRPKPQGTDFGDGSF